MKTYTATCDDCGYTKTSRTEGLAQHGLRLHSCDKHRERLAKTARRLAREAAVDKTPKPCLHAHANHQHGHYATYTLDYCRCPPCSKAATEYERKRVRRHAYGRFDNEWVDAQPARAHVRQLMAAGLGLKRIVRLSGYSQGAMTKLIYGVDGPPTKRIRAEHAQAILAIRATIDTLADAAIIDGTGTRRRVQALIALGWSQTKLAKRIGWTTRNFGYLANGERPVQVKTAKAVRDLYDELWDVEPPHATSGDKGAYHRSLHYAAQRGWVPPMGWDDDTIDDPQATPDLGHDETSNRGRPIEHVIEDLEWLLEHDPLATAQHLAHRLGFRDANGIQVALRRAGRTDLLDQLNRNAEIAGHAGGRHNTRRTAA